MKKYIGVIFFLSISIVLFSQKTTSRLTIESGHNVFFSFNTLSDYENGKTYTNWTRLTVDYDTTGGSATTDHWKLEIRALTPQIDGTGTNSLPLDVIDIEATDDNPDSPLSTPMNLTNAPGSYIITNGRVGVTNVLLTYHCGKDIAAPFYNLMGSNPDYYVVEIQITLEPQ